MEPLTPEMLDTMWDIMFNNVRVPGPNTILVHKGWGIERIRQVVNSGAIIMCDQETFNWIQENL